MRLPLLSDAVSLYAQRRRSPSRTSSAYVKALFRSRARPNGVNGVVMAPGLAFATAHGLTAKTQRLNGLVCRSRDFGRAAPSTVNCRRVALRMLSVDAIQNRSFQLEEMEDEHSSTSAVYLKEDGSVSHGRTDGPVPERVDGAWTYNEGSQELVIDLNRHFQEGEIEFSVRRLLRGHAETSGAVQDMAVFSGNIFRGVDDFEDPKSALGHWSLTVASDGLPSENFDATAAS